MARLELTAKILDYLVIGGSFYGGGGGGSTVAGREAGREALALGAPFLVDLDDLPDDTLLLTVSAVGSPAGEGIHAGPKDYVRAALMFKRYSGLDIGGFIANECGGLATVNGWVQSAATGLPIVDAPCNGRAHPTGAMGSMGLDRALGYISEQAAVGGAAADGSPFEVFIRAGVNNASGLVRRAAAQAGGLVAVARNPVSVSYARKKAAPGAIRRCLHVGQAIMDAKTPDDAVSGAAFAAGGSIIRKGMVSRKRMESVGGFDLGYVTIDDGKSQVELYFCNEYLTADEAGTRLHTFPDLIMTLDLATGLPVTTAEIREGQEVAVAVVAQTNLVLGVGMRNPELFSDVERITGKELVKYAFPEGIRPTR